MKISNDFDLDVYSLVANNINKHLKLKGISILELSNYAEIDSEYLQLFLSGKKDEIISIYDLYKISKVLNISMEQFFLK